MKKLYSFIEESLRENSKRFLISERLGSRWYSYTGEELLKAIELRKKGLSSVGISENSLVCLFMKRGVEWLINFSSLLGIGAVVIPLDFSLKDNEILAIMDDLQADFVIVDGEAKKDFCETLRDKEYLRKIICSRRGLLEEKEAKGLNTKKDSHIPDNLALIVYTSGTDGKPKGVMLSSENIEYCAKTIWEEGALEGVENTLNILPFCHIYGLTCGLLSMIYGGVNVFISTSIKSLREDLASIKPNFFLGVPLIYQKFKDFFKRALSRGVGRIVGRMPFSFSKIIVKRKLTTLFEDGAVLYSGGAPIDKETVEFFNDLGFYLLNGYGLTETSPVVSLETKERRKIGSVGKPLRGTEVAIKNPDGDGIGEVVVKGPGVMLGYYRKEEETSKVIKNGWLHTGDLGYIDNDGFLYIVGRKKNIIVTPEGKSVSPEEIEEEILKSPFVEEVVVKGEVITAFVYPNMDSIERVFGSLDSEEVVALIREEVKRYTSHFPSYKRVKRVEVRFSEFPKTYTRKIKRQEVL